MNSNKNSNAMPYMWAMGRMLMMLSPGTMALPSTCSAKSALLHMARYGSITPFEKPVVPLV